MEYSKELIKQHANVCASLDAAGHPMHGVSSSMLDQLLERIAELEKDAARYAFVKTISSEMLLAWRGMYGFADEAIDTAMQKD